MPGFTTTGDSWTFRLDKEASKPSLPEEPSMATSYLAGADRWANWCDDTLYECDCLVRQLFEAKKDDPRWNQSNARYRRFTTGMVFEMIFGRKYENGRDAKAASRLSQVLAYYSTRVAKSGSINGKKYTKTIYTLSPKRYRTKPPYSLRLRLEWLQERGELPTWRNMAVPKDDLKPGHARNKRTDENMERRREQAKRRYNERYRDRAH